jgi:uncharacterized protein YodC (DUF2158 family)
MQRRFQDGDEVVHKSDKSHRMTVVGYTGDSKVICRRKEKSEFKTQDFLEAELEKCVPPEVGGGAFIIPPGILPF